VGKSFVAAMLTQGGHGAFVIIGLPEDDGSDKQVG
jgi:hypothetical protein